MAEAVARSKGGDPLALVSVVVPTNHVAVAGRRALAVRGQGVAAVDFLTLSRLAERLGATRLAAAGRRPVSPAALAQAVRRVLHEEPGFFASVAGHPATERALVSSHRELAGLSEDRLNAVAQASARAAEVVRVHRHTRAVLAPDWHDEHDLMEAAVAALGQDPSRLTSSVILYLPQDLSAGGAALIRSLAERAQLRAIVGRSGEEAADHALDRALARAGIDLATAANAAEPAPAHAQRILSVSDPDEEVRTVVRRIVTAAREGIPFARMGIIYAGADPYLRLLHQHLDAADVPHHGAPLRTLGQSLTGRSLLALLALPDRNFRRHEVMTLVSSSPLLDAGVDPRPVPGRAWQRISREAGVVDGDDWDHRLATFARAERNRADASDEEYPGRARRHRKQADQAEALAGFVARLQADLAEGGAAPDWASAVRWSLRLIDQYLGGHRRRRRWPDEERRAAERVEAALDGLAGLDQLGGPMPTMEVFRRTLDEELSAGLARGGRFGHGVLVGHVSLATGVDFDRLFVLGLAEGAFPGSRLEDSLLADSERRRAGGELALSVDALQRDRRRLLAAMAGAGETTLCFPRGDLRRPGNRNASRWLLADAVYLAGRAPLFTGDLAGLAGLAWFEEVPSFAAGLVRSDQPTGNQDYSLAALARPHPGSLASHPAVTGDPGLATGLDLVQARRSSAFTRFDGNLSGLDLPTVADGTTVVSATRLQDWASCPLGYLLGRLLHVEKVTDPEEAQAISALDKGSLIHEVLETFLNEAIEDGIPDGPWPDDQRRRMAAIANRVCDEFEDAGRTGKRLFWRRDRARLLADLDHFLAEDQAFRQTEGVRPTHTEFAFGMDDGTAAAKFPLPDGRTVIFRGAVDRVDRGTDGHLVVTDYKTGTAARYQDLGPNNPHGAGTLLQLAVYGVAVRQALGTEDTHIYATYWFPTAKGRFKRIGYPVDAPVVASVGRAVATIVDGIAAGLFPARPSAKPTWGWIPCDYCDPDGLGTGELRRAWERKRADPALATYVALCEPEVLNGAG